MKDFLKLTKFGIVVFVLITAFISFLMALPVGSKINYELLLIFLLGLYFLSSGSFILNQAQEWKIDSKMNRTLNRPIVKKKLSSVQAYFLSFIFIFVGSFFLFFSSYLSLVSGLICVLFYNFLYTLWWKKKTAFAALLGAIPGAFPALIGFSAVTNNLLSLEFFYLFSILFLWQMPHFFALSLKYKEDYRKGNLPVAPIRYGDEKTFFYSGIYLFAMILLALSYPFYLTSHLFYFLSLIISIKCVWDFYSFMKDSKKWIRFFLSVNLALLVFLLSPLLDKMIFYSWNPF